MNHFQSAFTTWLNNHSGSTLRALSHDSGVDSSMLSLIRKGTRQITFDAIAKLLPAIERHSSRAAAVTLLIAYLTDETPPSHSHSIRIEPVDATGQLTADLYHGLAARWESKARTDPDFMTMWQGIDSYMHNPDSLTPRQTSDIALLAEPQTPYTATPRPRPGHPQDTNRLDTMPTAHAAQEHHEP